ncbi:hypothetical protein [Carboxylicivirga sp. M1479]|uniref:hypothetical protein n=1 Tax=Carboxylicivirga sp. M1479 TaxID=2594476 RepID=UPI0011776CFF|nr:hypothetical protein [Carboxylicivirga sp. M1479]TRX66259.1 hypothetical protein FNN09_14585 [Carboxylicivirga sp. M1479]
MRHKRNLTVFFIIAITVTSTAYILDNDVLYEEWTNTVIEFSIITFILFALLSAVYGIIFSIKSYLNHK